ncbi:hypothetical protein LMG10661_03830 [Ralstonia syzygii subsp. syzygii]|nr:hypothetical protein LMG10661_03830 [Ralstonia syzygii subsp. syzygii]
MTASMFLTDDEVSRLTGRKMKGAQIDALRQMGVPFFVNATGHAVVTRAAIEGGNQPVVQKPARGWSPKVLKAV